MAFVCGNGGQSQSLMIMENINRSLHMLKPSGHVLLPLIRAEGNQLFNVVNV